MFLLVFIASCEQGPSFLDGLHEKYEPTDENVEIVTKHSRSMMDGKKAKPKNRLKPAFPEKNLEDEYFKKSPVEYDEIFDEFSVEKENPEVQPSKQNSIALDDFSHYTKLIAISPFRLIAGRTEDISFELQPTSFKFGYGKFDEKVVHCNLDARSRMICPSPRLKPGEIKVSFSRDNQSWTNAVPAFVYRTNFFVQWIVVFIVLIFVTAGSLAVFMIISGRFEFKFSSKKPAALVNNAATSELP